MSTEENKTEDLDKLRDDKCFPVARSIIKEFPNGLIPPKGKDQKPFQLKCLSLMLNFDLNVSQEVSYVSQVILGVLAGLNKTVQETGMMEPDDERYIAITNKMFVIIGEEVDKITLGKVTPEDTTKDFSVIKDKFNALFAEEKLTRLEVKYIMDSIFEGYTGFNNAIQLLIANATERMEAKILGIESMSDLTLKKIDETLIN